MAKNPILLDIKAKTTAASNRQDHRQLNEIILRAALTYATTGDISPLSISIQTIFKTYKEYGEQAAKVLEGATLGHLKYEPVKQLVVRTKNNVDKKSIRAALTAKGITKPFSAPPLPRNTFTVTRNRLPANRRAQTRGTLPPASWQETISIPDPPVDITEELRKFLVTIHNKMHKNGYMAGQGRIFRELVALAKAHGIKTDPTLFGKFGLPRGKTQEEMG